MTRSVSNARHMPSPRSHRAPELSRPHLLQPVPLAARWACGVVLAGGVWLPPAMAQTAAGEEVLPKVKVSASQLRADELPPAQPGGQAGSGARLGLLGNQDALDTPFSVTSYTAKLIEDQQAKTVADVLNSDASVRFTTSGSHAVENFRLRGFDLSASDLALGGLYGLAPVGSSTLEFVERIEVLKGPSAMFTGMAPSGGVGGMISLVPKRAADEDLTRFTLGSETGSQVGGHLDLGRRFGVDNAFGVRINASYSDGDTALQGQSKQRHMLSAALDYRGTALNATLDLYDTKLSFEGGSPVMYGFATTDLPAAPDPTVNMLPGAAGDLENRAVIAHVDYAIDRDLSVFGGLGVRQHDYSGFINGTHAHSIAADGSALVRGVAQRGYSDATSAEAGARLSLATGPVRHEWVLQATHLAQETGGLRNLTGMQATNIYQPIALTLPAMPTGAVPKDGETTLSSLALVDTLSMLQDRLRLTVGLRQQQVRQTSFDTSSGAVTADYDKRALTPALGVVFKPWGDEVSLYANHVEGLSQGMNLTTLNGYAQDRVTSPYKTRQKELGAKWRAGAFTHTAALFEITQPTVVTDYSAGYGAYTASDDNEMRVRGVEWSGSGQLLPSLSVLGGLSYTKGVLTRTWNGENQGHEIYGVPHWQANLGAQWETPAAGLSLNARVIATSKQYLDSTNTYQIPGWGRLDLGAAYRTQLAERPLVLRVNVDNALDRHYWSGAYAEQRATLAQGRIVRASATMDF